MPQIGFCLWKVFHENSPGVIGLLARSLSRLGKNPDAEAGNAPMQPVVGYMQFQQILNLHGLYQFYMARLPGILQIDQYVRFVCILFLCKYPVM
jgi:hypothetical protein